MKAFKTTRRIAPLFLCTLLSLAACKCDVDVGPDASDIVVIVPDASVLENDGGTPADVAPDVIIVQPPEEIALAFCTATRRGLLNYEQRQAQATTLCTDDTPIADIGTGDIELELGACTPADELYREILNAVNASRATFDTDALLECQNEGRGIRQNFSTFAELAENEAGLLGLKDSNACQSAIVAQQGANDICEYDFECTGTLRCETLNDQSARACLPPATEGQACFEEASANVLSRRRCDDASACVLQICTRRLSEGLECNAEGVPCALGLTCSAAGLCAAPAQQGEACTQNQHCAESLTCDEGLCANLNRARGEVCQSSAQCTSPCDVCRDDGSQSPQRVCAPKGQADDTCSGFADCESDFYCNLERCVPRTALGEICVRGSCVEGSTCSNAGEPPLEQTICQARPDVGEACTDFGLRCLSGSCFEGLCQQGALLDPCASNANCLPALFCQGAAQNQNGICAELPRVSAPCGPAQECVAEARCINDRCTAFPAVGEACFEDGACNAQSFCQDDLCVARKNAGEACGAANECTSEVCLDIGVCANRGTHCLSASGTLLPIFGLSSLILGLRLRRRRNPA